MNFGFLASIFFPRRCLACGAAQREGTLCATCRAGITVRRTLFCGQCGGALYGAAAGGSGISIAARVSAAISTCHPAFPYVLGAATSYENKAVSALIQALKFRGRKTAAAALASIAVEYLLPFKTLLTDYVIVPIPLSRERGRKRGFNQSELIARPLAEVLGLSCDTGCLARVRDTKPQTDTKSAAERRNNVRDCFAVVSPPAVQGKNIILLDDVSTSGTTFLEAAKALRAAAAGTIIAVAIAKA